MDAQLRNIIISLRCKTNIHICTYIQKHIIIELLPTKWQDLLISNIVINIKIAVKSPTDYIINALTSET